jgi:hypothetical protein
VVKLRRGRRNAKCLEERKFDMRNTFKHLATLTGRACNEKAGGSR